MPRGRGGLILLAFFIAITALAVWLLLRRSELNLFQREGQIPIELKNIIPAKWILLEKQPQPCNLDDDPDNEWLLLYHYDQTSTANVYAGGDSRVNHNPIGGVVYDAQVNRVPQELGSISPYRPALLVPYKLLPDYYTGKGQGYLGENDVRFYPYAAVPKGTKEETGCRAEELYFLGYSYMPLPTRLSIFRWAGRATGYEGIHFIGDAHVDAPGAVDTTTPINQVTTYNRLDNHRSLLCEVRRFARPEGSKTLNFPEDPNSFTIDFCFGTPEDPAYPEAALVALLRGAEPPTESSPTGPSFLTRNADLDSRLAFLRSDRSKREKVRILSVANQGTVAPRPNAGNRCPPEVLVTSASSATETPGNRWWCAAEEAYVEVEIVLGNNSVQRAIARLISIANEQVTADVHWRVTSLKLE